MRGLSLVVASGGQSSSRCAGLSLSRPLLLRSTGSRRAGSVVVVHGPSCSAACGIFPDQGSNPCPLHWQADSQPLRHQGSPLLAIFIFQLLFNVFTFQFWKNAFRPVNAELLPGFLASIRAASPVHTGNRGTPCTYLDCLLSGVWPCCWHGKSPNLFKILTKLFTGFLYCMFSQSACTQSTTTSVYRSLILLGIKGDCIKKILDHRLSCWKVSPLRNF